VGLPKDTISFGSITPDAVGAALDLGVAMKLNNQWRFGAALANPLMYWGATQNTYKYVFSSDPNAAQAISVNATSQRVNFSQGEPMVARVGASYQPLFKGAPAYLKDVLVTGGVDAPLNDGLPPSVSLGAEKRFGPLALRLGTSQAGISPLYTAGIGFESRAFQVNLGLGVDSPAIHSAAAAFSLGAGF
jgi:hypothetical protein